MELLFGPVDEVTQLRRQRMMTLLRPVALATVALSWVAIFAGYDQRAVWAFAILSSVAAVGAVIVQSRRGASRRGTEASEDGQSCVACGSRQLEQPAPGVYTCDACGHTGGPGYAEHVHAQRLAAIDAMDPAERIASGRADLAQIEHLRLSLRSERSYAADPYARTTTEGGVEIDLEAQAAMANIVRMGAEIERLERESQYKLTPRPGDPAP